MSDPRSLYRASKDGWDDLRGKRPVLLVLLDGAASTGRVQDVLAAHLREHCTGRRIAVFDIDLLTQYADRRPVVELEDGRLTRPRPPELALWALTDAAGETFLVLHGPEPMLLWQRLAAAIGEIIATLQVRLLVNVSAVPMRVPHTRPTQVFTHASDPELVLHPWEAIAGALTLSATFGTFLEVALGEQDQRTLGIDVCVPYYLGRNEHVASASAALEVLQASCGLNLVPGPLEEAARQNRDELDAQVAATENGTQVLSILESGYDEFRSLASDLPSADELGAEFERFLAERDRGRDTGDGDAQEG